MTTLALIDDFLSQKRLAIVGVSHRPQDFSRTLFREFRNRGYEVVPVNPAIQEIEGQPCFASVRDVPPPVSNVLLMTSPAVSESVVRDCADAGVQRVWMYRASGAGAVSAEAVGFCAAKGIAVIPGECPFMFLPGGAWFHRVHGWVKRSAAPIRVEMDTIPFDVTMPGASCCITCPRVEDVLVSDPGQYSYST